MSKTTWDVSELSDAIDRAPRKPVILKFSARWCQPCKVLSKQISESPVIQNALQSGQVALFDIDVDDSPECAQEWQVRSLPAVRVSSGAPRQWRDGGRGQAACLKCISDACGNRGA